MRDTDRVTTAMQRGIDEALRLHGALGHPVAMWDAEAGKVVWVQPGERKAGDQAA